jgi:polyhydroxyalkanoate synthesis regulator phasin
MLESLETLRELVSRGLLRQLEVVMLSRDRIQDALDDAVVRGRMTRGDAEDLFTELFRRGRRQTEDLINELEQLVGRAGDQLGTAAKRATPKPPDRVIREADRVRRVAGVGPSFPIVGYDDLTAAKVVDRLGDLTPAELRKVRDYERRTANRKSVLAAIEKALR